MNTIAVLKDLTERPIEALGYFWDHVRPEHLNVHPLGHPNSIAWLLWHSGREMDVQVAHLAGHDQVWTAQDFAGRFAGEDAASENTAEDMGFGHNTEEAKAIAVPETQEGKQLLADYLRAVVEQCQRFVDSLDDDDLDRVIDESYDEPVTLGVRYVSVITDALQHLGQAAYVAGMPELGEQG